MRLIDAEDYLYRERPVGLSDELYEESHLYKSIMEQEVIQAIPIPEGATNGDMIKAMFTNQTISCAIPITDRNGAKFYRTTINGVTDFTADWWNAPYKGVEE